MRRACKVLLPLLLVAYASTMRPAPAQASDALAPRVYVLTLGPGDHPFFKFGHNAIWIEPPTGGGLVYNFGTFAFDSPSLIPKFILGRFHYWLSVSPIDETLWSYQSSNRTIEAQELNLTPQEALDLEARLKANARPENREYLYDYFYDNCSTRVRDAVDTAFGGALKRSLQPQAGLQSFRAHALRLTEDVYWEYVALFFALSGRTDFQPSRWQESFVPQVFQRALRDARIDRPGGPEPAVKREFVVFPAPGRIPPVETPPARTWLFLLAGLAAGAALFGMTRLAHRNRGMRVLLGVGLCLGGLVVGVVGGFLLFIWLFTNHVTSQANENILQAPVWMLALTVAGVGVARGRRWGVRWARKLFWLACVASLLGLVLKVVPGFQQQNLPFILFFMPVWAAGAVGFQELRAVMR